MIHKIGLEMAELPKFCKPSLEGRSLSELGRLWPVQGFLSIMLHGMVGTRCGMHFSLFLTASCASSSCTSCMHPQDVPLFVDKQFVLAEAFCLLCRFLGVPITGNTHSKLQWLHAGGQFSLVLT